MATRITDFGGQNVTVVFEDSGLSDTPEIRKQRVRDAGFSGSFRLYSMRYENLRKLEALSAPLAMISNARTLFNEAQEVIDEVLK